MREHVGPRVEEEAVGGEPVAPRAPDLLVVGLDRARHLAVDHVAHVRLVDPHAEGDGGDHDVGLVAREGVLVALADGVVEAGVVGDGAHARSAQVVGERLDVPAAERIDDAALARAPADPGEEVLPRAPSVALLVRRENQVRAEEGALEAVGLHHAELADDVADHAAGGGRGEGEDGDAAELLLESLEPPVRGPEVVAPLRDAVRLVDDHERHVHAGEEAAQVALEALGRDVGELVLAGPEPAQPIALGLPVERRVDHRRPEAVPRERVHLVLHERDERAHDEHGAGDEARGDLEGERLARARRHDADAVAPREHGRDDLLLPRAKLGVAEDAGQDVAGSEAGRERELIDAGRIAEMSR